MATQSQPNYNAIDEAVDAHPGIRVACIGLGLVIVAVIHAARWVAQYSPMVGG